jgi:Transglycosylase-like domain
MRKLTIASFLCLIAALPALAIAAPIDRADAPVTEPDAAPVVRPALGNPLHVHEARRKLRIARLRAVPAIERPVAVPSHLQAIAVCESGGDPTAIGGGGLYRGKYQFSVSTWQSVGGSGDPAAAPEAEQDRRAIMLYDRSGPGQWPVCGS